LTGISATHSTLSQGSSARSIGRIDRQYFRSAAETAENARQSAEQSADDWDGAENGGKLGPVLYDVGGQTLYFGGNLLLGPFKLSFYFLMDESVIPLTRPLRIH